MTSDSHPPDLILAAAFDGRPLLLIAVYCLLIVGASLVGGWLPTVVRLTHVRTQVLVSFVAGLMLGIAFLHLLPHAVAEIGRSEVLSLDGEVHALDRAVRWTLGGFLAMFFLIRAFHFHHHGDIELPANVHQHDHAGCDVQSHAGRATSAPPAPPPPHEHHGHTPHRHAAPAPAPAPLPALHGLSWLGVFFGLAVHTLIDGMALAASVRAEAAHGDGLGVYGVGTFLAILLHKPLDAVSITALMAAGGWSAGWRNVVNAGFAVMCPLGAAVLVVGADVLAGDSSLVVGCALAFSAGVFLCISAGDLLPEVEFHSHDRLKLSLTLLLGIALAWVIGLLEPSHAHRARPASNGAGQVPPESGQTKDRVPQAAGVAFVHSPNGAMRDGAAVPTGRITHPPVREASGLAASRRFPGVYWTVCDSGQPPDLYAIDRTGRLLAEYRVEGASNFDWESIAIDDEGRLYIGDVGNNVIPGGLRRRVVYRVAEPDPRAVPGTATVNVERAFWYRFPDRPFDVEATFVSGGRLYLVRKVHARDEQTELFRLPLDASQPTTTLEPVCRLPDLPAITGADLSHDGRRLALCGYRAAFVYDLPEDHAWERLAEMRPTKIDYKAPSIESCAWDAEHPATLLILSENGSIYALAARAGPGRSSAESLNSHRAGSSVAGLSSAKTSAVRGMRSAGNVGSIGSSSSEDRAK